MPPLGLMGHGRLPGWWCEEESHGSFHEDVSLSLIHCLLPKVRSDVFYLGVVWDSAWKTEDTRRTLS